MKNIYIVLILCALSTVIVFFIAQNSGSTQQVSVVLNNEGFVPKISTINVGDEVVFKNQTSMSFWPASNYHPGHDEYPDFDPRKAVGPGEEWSFIFLEKGEYPFHDHLNSFTEGIIIVQ
jgi:plastocyanin